MQDQITNRHFLVDTGASYSIIPHCSFLPATGPKLIPCWGDRLEQLRFQVQDFSWKFLLADVAFPIFGVDFLRFHKLLIDPEGHAFLDNTGRRFASQVRPSLLMATVVIRFVQQYVLAWGPHPWPTPPDQSLPEQCPLHPTPPDQPAPDQSVLDQSPLKPTQPDQPASRAQNRQERPTAACLRSLGRWSAHQSSYCWSAMTLSHIVTHGPLITSKL
jgi:hypothetical protein